MISQRLELWQLNTTLEREIYTLPWRFGYLRLHPTKEDALHAVEQSHDAFCVWVGYCSYLMLLRQQPMNPSLQNPMPRWAFELTHDPNPPTPGYQPVEAKIIKEIEESELVLFDTSFPRAGVIVYDTCQFLRSVTELIKYKVPVYLFWGVKCLTQSYHPHKLDKKYRPTDAQGTAAMRATLTAMHTLQMQSHVKPTSQIRHRGVRRQKRGEHPWEYLTRRAHEIADWYRQADAKEREAIDKRALSQRDFPRPGFPKGPICFLWEEDCDTGVITQNPYTRTDVQSSWGSWKSSHKRFDPVERSWDVFEVAIPPTIEHYSQLLSDFSLQPHSLNNQTPQHIYIDEDLPLLDSTHELEHYEDLNVPATSTSIQPQATITGLPTSSDSLEASTLSNNDEEQCHATALVTQASWQPSRSERLWAEASKGPPIDIDDDEQVEPSYRFSNYRTLLDNLFERFGFASMNDSQSSEPIDRRQWINMQKFVGHHKSDDTLQADEIASIAHFLGALMEHRNDIEQLRQIQDHDIANNAVCSLVAQLEAEPIELAVHRISLEDGSVLYALKSNDMQVADRWALVLENPTTVVQCLRQKFGGSVKNIARYLYYSGIPFSTCISRAQKPSNINNLPYRPLSLGWRAQNHRPTTADYAEYEEIVDTLLHRPYGRAALLQGGIVWRLALLCLGRSEIDVTRGPSIDASLLGKVSILSDGSNMYDDSISDDEIDVICGVYRIDTGVFLS